MTDKNPLLSLLIDEEEISKRADGMLAAILTPYVNILKSSGEIQFTTSGSSLKNSNKVLVTLAARLAAKRLGLSDDETMSQKELIDTLKEEGVAEGSVKSALNYLRNGKLISKTQNSRCYIGLDKLTKLQNELRGSGNE